LARSGAIDSFEAFFLDCYGGDMRGFLLIQGGREKLNRMRTDPEFENRSPPLPPSATPRVR
jgi:hypothetical protein